MVDRKQDAGKRVPVEDRKLQQFADAIQANREGFLTDWRLQVRRLPAAQNLDVPTLNDHIPALLDQLVAALFQGRTESVICLLYTSPSPRDRQKSRMPSSA